MPVRPQEILVVCLETARASVFLTWIILTPSVPPSSLLLCGQRVNSLGLSRPEWGKVPHKWSIVVLVTDLALFESSVFDFLHFSIPCAQSLEIFVALGCTVLTPWGCGPGPHPLGTC